MKNGECRHEFSSQAITELAQFLGGQDSRSEPRDGTTGEYATGSRSLEQLPQQSRETIDKLGLNHVDLLLGTVTSSSSWVEEINHTLDLYDYLVQAETSGKLELKERYLRYIYHHLRKETADFLHADPESVVFDLSGTHAALFLRFAYPNSYVITTTETGGTLPLAYEGRAPGKEKYLNVHGETVDDPLVIPSGEGRVDVVNLRQGKEGKPRQESEIHKEIITNIYKAIRASPGEPIIIHLPLPPKTGASPEARIDFARVLRDPQKARNILREQLSLTDIELGDIDLSQIIVVADMAQTRMYWGEYDPTDEKDGFCDIALATSSKAMGGYSFGGVQLISKQLTPEIKERVRKNLDKYPAYAENFLAGGHLPPSWTDGLDLSSKVQEHNASLAARFLTTGDILEEMKELGAEKALGNAKEIKAHWDTLTAQFTGYSDYTSPETASAIAFTLEAARDKHSSNRLRHLLMTPFSSENMPSHLTETEEDAMRLLFEIGNPVSEKATLDEGEADELHIPINRIGIGWRQAIDWEKPERKRQIKKSLEYLAIKMKVLLENQCIAQ
ncbi:hypothetical protein KKB83_02930 [Patescibacteria group bacterium]|nr:hypothetical protein [Patescibacteria group bacterium]